MQNDERRRRHPGWSEGPDLRCAIAHWGISRFRVRCFASPRNDRMSKRADGKIAEPQIGVAAFFPEPEQRPVQRLPQQIIALADRNADALAEIAAFDEGPTREGAAFA